MQGPRRREDLRPRSVSERLVHKHDRYPLVATIRVVQGAKGVLRRQLTPYPIVSSERAGKLRFDSAELAKVGVDRQQQRPVAAPVLAGHDTRLGIAAVPRLAFAARPHPVPPVCTAERSNRRVGSASLAGLGLGVY